MTTWKTRLTWAYAMVFPIVFIGIIGAMVLILGYELLTNFEAYIPVFWFLLYWLGAVFVVGSMIVFLQLTGWGKP